ncbi:MAG: response regulator [Phycisphaerae bacterium]|jgi:CheY-like chemotaxis protein|nr:response regulator [Phycisphaerae bacterium]MCZ2399049.1 response regulator [Phycisphaerae bacterium]NUQ50105.1 response regulator [Phycisphaerae bacterium]
MTQAQGRLAVVLLVEDDPGDQELTRRALTEGLLRVDLRTVSDGEEALEYLYHRGRHGDPARSPAPDLVLMDLNMPGLDGRDVLRVVKADATLKSVPIVVLTTSRLEADILRSYDLGCNSFITKPVGVEGFVRAVQDLGAYWFELTTLPAGGGLARAGAGPDADSDLRVAPAERR